MEGVLVPRVHRGLSTERILTMEWVEGRHIGAYMKTNPSQEERDRYGSLIVRSQMRMCYSGEALYADVHPGNFVFMPDGHLGLIDFGCVHRYTPEDIDYLTQAERAAFVSRDAIAEAVIRGADLTERQRSEMERIDLMIAWYNWVCEPVVSKEPFNFADESYFRCGMEFWRELLRRRYVRSLPVNTWITKSVVGLRALLFRLGARVPYGQIMREETSVELPPSAAA
jgi:predicted unusual protein kinase regulating ubiquinone biosynthesis (AarF/ABC1/UbiB family)